MVNAGRDSVKVNRLLRAKEKRAGARLSFSEGPGLAEDRQRRVDVAEDVRDIVADRHCNVDGGNRATDANRSA
jgi:hypothetical protein